MDRNKIKGIILTLGAVTALGFGGNVNGYAAEKNAVSVAISTSQSATAAEKASAIERINNGKGEFKDYRVTLKIRQIQSDHVDFVNEAVKEAVNKKGSFLDEDEIWEVASQSIKLCDLYYYIEEGGADISEYEGAEITGVDEENIDDFNNIFMSKKYYLLEDIQAYIDNIISVQEKVCMGEAAVEDYNTLGITTGVSINNVNYINMKVKEDATSKGARLTISEIAESVSRAGERYAGIYRINMGQGALEDYVNLGVKGVDKNNLSYINGQILNKVNADGTNIQKEVDNILYAYRFIDAVNKGSETKDENGFVKEYFELNKVSIIYDTNSDSELSVIRRCVEIKRKLEGDRDLNKVEINSIINSVDSNFEDAKVMITKIDEVIEEKESLLERDLTNEEKQELINNIIKERKYAVRRIFIGKGTVEDFHSFGEYKVNDRNLETINKDIRDFKKINKLSDYRLEGLEEEVAEGIAIYNINKDNLTKNKDNLVKEYALLGIEVPYDFSSTSVFRVTQDYIIIMKKQDNKLTLGRQEILDIFSEVEINLDKYKILMPRISDAIFMEENELGRELTSAEVNKIVNYVEGELKGVVSRLVLGKASIEDFKLFGEDRVNSENIDIINKDISQNGGINKTSNYGIEGLKEAVNKGLAVYNLNNGIETAGMNGNVKEFETLGLEVESSNDAASLDKLVMKALQDKKDILGGKTFSRQDIIDTFEEVKSKKTNPPKEPVEEKKGLLVEYDVNNWGSGYQVNFKLTNNSDASIIKWAIKIKKDDVNILGSWNVNISEDGQYYIITPVGWNSYIGKGSSVDFGIQGSGAIGDTISYVLV